MSNSFAPAATTPNTNGVVLANSTSNISPQTCLITQHDDHDHAHHHHHRIQLDDGGNQSDSSTSNSSLASSPRYNERHPRVVVRKSGRGCGIISCGSSSGGERITTSRGSFVVIGSRSSLPPLDENCPLDATESQLALNLRRATRSTSWTNQKILDAIDGLNTCAKDLDPCLALGMSAGGGCCGMGAKRESPRRSFEKFVVPKSISNLIMQSRSSGSVNPTSGQNRENSCYNFLSGITEDEDEEQEDSSGKYSGGGTGGIRFNITPTSIPLDDQKRKHNVAGGEAVENNDDPSETDRDDDGARGTVQDELGRRFRNGNVTGRLASTGVTGITIKKVVIQDDDADFEDCSQETISTSSEMDSNFCTGVDYDKEEGNIPFETKGTPSESDHQEHLHEIRFKVEDVDITPQ